MSRQTTPSGVVEGPPMSLRGGAAVDDYHAAPQYDAEVDRPTPEYLEKYYWGIPHLDAVSWRYYLPILTEHALRNVATAESNAVDAFLASLRPPDHEPPRFASLTAEQEGALVAMLDTLAFGEASKWKSQAMLALEEYWAPGALYRGPRDNLLAEIRHAFPVIEMPSKRELRFHPEGCVQCVYISKYLDEHRNGPIDGAIIRHMHPEMTCLSAKGWSWALPYYLPFCLTPEAEYNRAETEYLVYNLGTSDEYRTDVKQRLSGLSKPQINCLKHFLAWLNKHPQWKEYFPEDIARAMQLLNEIDDSEKH